jgi:hypothetical protein
MVEATIREGSGSGLAAAELEEAVDQRLARVMALAPFLRAHAAVVDPADVERSRRTLEVRQQWPPGKVAWWAPGIGIATDWDTRKAKLERATRVMVITCAEESGQKDEQAEDPEKVRVSDGVAPAWADASDLEEVEDDEIRDVDHAAAARLFSHATATPSPRCTTAAKEADWDWLTAEGLGAAGEASLSVPPSAVPHLLGRGGRMIGKLENRLGVLIGVADAKRRGGMVTATLVGPVARLPLAQKVVALVSKGVFSILDRLPPGP